MSQIPPGALPPLKHQIDNAGAIIVAKTHVDNESITFEVLEVLKNSYKLPLHIGDQIQPNVKTFVLLGYNLRDNHDVILFFIGENLDTVFDLLSISESKIVYGANDPSVYQEMTLSEFRNFTT